jgi:hypothetical protein
MIILTLDGIIFMFIYFVGTGGGAVGRSTELQVGRSRFRFPVLSLEYFIDQILPAA